MKRKNLLLSSLLAVGAMTIVGCGGTQGGDSTGTVDILVHCQYGKTSGARGLLQTFAAEFNEKQSDYNVIVDDEISGDYTSVFKLEKTYLQDPNSESWGDLVVCYPDHVVDYQVDFRAVANLEKLMDDPKIGFTKADYLDFTKAASDQFDINFPKTGKYVLPFSTSTECMFYNPVILGLTLPGVNGGNRIDKNYINNLTWDEFFDVFCPALVEYNNGLTTKIFNPDGAENYGVLGYRDENNLFITLCEQYGYSYTSVDPDTAEASIDFNTKEVRDLMKKFNAAKNNHYLITEGSVTGGIGSYLGKNQCLFYIGSTGGISYTQTNLGDVDWEIECGRLPQASNETSRQKMISQGGSWCILEHTQNKEKRIRGAFEFYKYMTEVKQCTRWAAETGYYPIRKSVTAQASWGKLISETDDEGEMKEGIELLTARTASYCAQYDNILYTSAVFKGSAVAREQVDALMVKIMTRDEAECTDEWLLSEFNATVNEINKYLG